MLIESFVVKKLTEEARFNPEFVKNIGITEMKLIFGDDIVCELRERISVMKRSAFCDESNAAVLKLESKLCDRGYFR